MRVPLSTFAPASEEALVQAENGGLRVRTPSQQWAYAAIAPLGAVDDRPVTLHVQARVDSGVVGFGVLSRDGQFIVEQSMRVGESETIALELPSLSEASSFVVRSWAESGTRSDALIEDIIIREREPVIAAANSLASISSETLGRSWFLKYLHDEIPVLKESGATDWEKVNAVRDWAYANIPRAWPSAFLEEADGLPPELLFLAFEDYQGGFACGGTATLLADIYKYLGFEAYAYNMGSSDSTLTHVLTAVQIEHDQQEILVLQDAYFNFAVTDGYGSPLDFGQVLTALSMDEFASITLTAGDNECKPVIVQAEKVSESLEYHAHYYTVGAPRVRNGMAQYCHDFSLSTFEDSDQFSDWLEAKIGRRDFLYLLLFPLGTSGEAEIERLAQEAERIRQHLEASDRQ